MPRQQSCEGAARCEQCALKLASARHPIFSKATRQETDGLPKLVSGADKLIGRGHRSMGDGRFVSGPQVSMQVPPSPPQL